MSSFRFGTVAEGATDHALLENVLLGFFREYGLESDDVAPIQPRLDETGKQASESRGGWLEVISWLREGRYHDAFQFIDHLIVHVDTDVCEEVGFDVAKCVNGGALSPGDLSNVVRRRLEDVIGAESMQMYAGRIHFAIAVHEIECWLLPLWGRSSDFGRIHSCKQRVDDALNRSKQDGLRKNDVRTYSSASAPFRKRAILLGAATEQESLSCFLESLATVYGA